MPESTDSFPPPNSRHWSTSLLTSGWLWGLGLTFAFYAAIPYVPVDKAHFERYFTAHWIEYASTGLFFIGLATLLLRATSLPAERRVLSAGLLDGLDLRADEAAPRYG
jgi:hypothetical protein